MSFKDNKMKAFTLSYDDGVVQDIKFVELLNKYNLKCTFNLNSELFNKNGFIPYCDKKICHYKVHREDVKSIYDGHEVAVHTLTHPNLTQVDEKEIVRQVETDRQNLSEIVGYDVVGMAYPCGGVNNNDKVANIIKANTGVKYSRTITCTHSFDLQNNLYRFNPCVYHLDFDKLWELGKKFVEMKTDIPQIFYIWGHTYEFDYETEYWSKMEEFFEFISKRDDIFYATNKEILL